MSLSSGISGSSGSASFGGRNFAKVGGRRCKCLRQAIVYTSRTDANFKRDFFGCPYYKEKKPYCDYFKWVDEAGKEDMELEEGRMKEVAEMDFKMKYVVMKLNEQEMKMNEQDRKLMEQEMKMNEQDRKLMEQEMKINEQDRKLKELSVNMVSHLDTMEKNYRHVGRAARVVVVIIVGLVLLCILLGCKLSMKENVPKLCLPK